MLLKVDITPLHGIKPIWIGINIVTTVHSFLICDGQWVSAHFMEKIVPPHKTSLSTLFCSYFLFVWTVLWPLLNAFDLTRRVEYWTITVECSCVWQTKEEVSDTSGLLSWTRSERANYRCRQIQSSSPDLWLLIPTTTDTQRVKSGFNMPLQYVLLRLS